MAMHIDEVLEGIYQRLCIRAQDSQPRSGPQHERG
jgi:hypothetical protein